MRISWILLLLALSMTAWAQNFADIPFTPQPITARVPSYTLKSDLSNVRYTTFLPKLSDAQRKLLQSNGFVARPTPDEQLFYVYENNAYRKIPGFVTTDSVMHTYHIFYDFTLRYIEQAHLFGAVKELSRRILQANLTALKTPHSAKITDALTHNAAFFAVPLLLMGEQPTVPAAVRSLANDAVQKIDAHADRSSSLTDAEVNYTQFIPRGHYTRSEDFKKYFKAMMWFGLTPMDIDFQTAHYPRPILMALIMVEQLMHDQQARTLWHELYDPTVFYVGKADDLNYDQLATVLDKVFATGAIDRFDDTAKITQFRELAKNTLSAPGIQLYNFREGGGQGRQFRFMGQRFIPDSRILQELTWNKVGTVDYKRNFPYGLDVFAVLGSQRAAQLLDDKYQQPKYTHYLEQRKKLQDEIAAMAAKDWRQNLYYGWMYCLLPSLAPAPEGYPVFMRTAAWTDKSLLSALGSWTELRHDTLLYAKQSDVAECGDSEAPKPPPPLPGYIEPQVAVYERLAWLLKLNKAGLIQRNLCSAKSTLAGDFDQFIDVVNFLATASRKELRNESLSDEELRSIKAYGGTLESLMLSMNNLMGGNSDSWWNIQNKTDRSMALIADVHSANGECLEEAVGNAAEIWVVVPFKGTLVLTRGATYTYYEFHHSAADRLTDEAWQAELRAGKAPALPDWTRSFLLTPARKAATDPSKMGDSTENGGGC